MAKESPWFKFFTGEWANGSITLENYSVQGVFINVCCFYWSKQGDVTKKQLESLLVVLEKNETTLNNEISKLEARLADNQARQTKVTTAIALF